MLTVTTEATDVIRDLLAAENAPAGGGVHLRAPRAGHGEGDKLGGVDLEVVSTAPPTTEQRLVGQECRLFLDQEVAAYLHDKVLDATHNADGQVRFTLTRQPPPPAP